MSKRRVVAAVLFLLLARAALAAEPGRPLLTLRSEDLHFGTSVYPFRSKVDPRWILSEAKALGLTEVRVEYSRDRVERDGRLVEPRRDVVELLRRSGLDVLLTLDGTPGSRKGKPVDWPRKEDRTIDGEAAAPGEVRYARWAVEGTRDFVAAYELWNEAFGGESDPIAKHRWGQPYGFGPGGSLQNANGYAALMLPVARAVKKIDPRLPITVEGNYWNLARSAGSSPALKELIRTADFMVFHPYDYKRAAYEKGREGKETILDRMEFYRALNPRIRPWWSEYGITPHDVSPSLKVFRDITQTKGLLRSTLLHMEAGVGHLDFFCLSYPSIPHFSLIDASGRRRGAFDAFQRFLAAVAPKKRGESATLSRVGELPEGMRDLAVARPGGFAYFVWQETPVERFDENVPPRSATVTLRTSTGKKIRAVEILDPITGRPVEGARAESHDDGTLVLTLAVPDYPVICRLAP